MSPPDKRRGGPLDTDRPGVAATTKRQQAEGDMHPMASSSVPRHLVLVDHDAFHLYLPKVLTCWWSVDVTMPPVERRLVLHGEDVQTWDHRALQCLAWRLVGRSVQLIGVDLTAWGAMVLQLSAKYDAALIGPAA